MSQNLAIRGWESRALEQGLIARCFLALFYLVENTVDVETVKMFPCLGLPTPLSHFHCVFKKPTLFHQSAVCAIRNV